MEDVVLMEIEYGVALITLNRPHRHNAINQALLARLFDCLDEVATNDDIKVAILTGQGKSFCSGLDLEIIMKDNLRDPRGDGKGFLEVRHACKKPLIGAINGHAITGGFEIALNCDFLIASEKASFTDSHARVGIPPGWGMTQLLQQAVGQRRAKQLSFTCQPLAADIALQWGLVNEVVPHEKLIPRAKQLATDICLANQDILSTIKDLIEFQDGATLTESLAHEVRGCQEFAKKMQANF